MISLKIFAKRYQIGTALKMMIMQDLSFTERIFEIWINLNLM